MKVRIVIFYAIYSIIFVGVGWKLSNYYSKKNANNEYHFQTPYVITKSLKEVDITQKKKYIAQIEAINSVDVIPQVSGYVNKIKFTEGNFIKKGDILITIEDEKYKANLDLKKASVVQLEAEYKRVASLYKDKYISKSDLEIAESNLKQAEANLKLAEIDLEHTQIKSPINGYIGKALITEGNYVSSNSQSLARIIQTNPMRIVFSISDKDKAEFLKMDAKLMKNLNIDLVLPDKSIETVKVNKLFLNNEVNIDTATIPVYLNVSNEKGLLTAGSYLDIYFKLSKEEKAFVIPQLALSEDNNGSYVMVINDKNIVEKKYVVLGKVIEDGQIIKSGLEKTDKFVVQGLQKISEGMTVNSKFLND